jgi:RNA-splicing ligase RtcB
LRLRRRQQIHINSHRQSRCLSSDTMEKTMQGLHHGGHPLTLALLATVLLGVIPGSMASPAFVVRGRGNAASLNSASHGAGRRMSRKKARDKYNWKATQNDLEKKGVRVLSAGADEVPGVYKDIEDVMREQADLVEIVARFDPKIVKMCDDGSKAED